MKKIILGLAVISSAVVANAEYLYWSVSSSEAAAAHANGAILWWNNADGSSLISVDNFLVANTTSSLADLTKAGVADYTTGSYYIELVNYTGSTASHLDPQVTSSTYTYSDMSGAFITSMSDLKAATMVMTMTGPKATPEPTSGLLLLMGFAMLGLKRKKEV